MFGGISPGIDHRDLRPAKQKMLALRPPCLTAGRGASAVKILYWTSMKKKSPNFTMSGMKGKGPASNYDNLQEIALPEQRISDIFDFRFKISNFVVSSVERLVIENSAIHIPHSAIGQEHVPFGPAENYSCRLPGGRPRTR